MRSPKSGLGLAWRYVEAAAPLCDPGVLVTPNAGAAIQHHAGALVCHAKLVRVHRHAGDARHREVKGGNGVAELAGERQDKATQACVGVEHDLVLDSQLQERTSSECKHLFGAGLLSARIGVRREWPLQTQFVYGQPCSPVQHLVPTWHKPWVVANIS